MVDLKRRIGQADNKVRLHGLRKSGEWAEEPMPVTVRIPTPLQRLAGGKSEVVCSATSIAGLLAALELEHPGMKERLAEGGKVRRFINIYVNGEDIRALGAETTALKDGDTVAIIAAIAGGWRITSS